MKIFAHEPWSKVLEIDMLKLKSEYEDKTKQLENTFDRITHLYQKESKKTKRSIAEHLICSKISVLKQSSTTYKIGSCISKNKLQANLIGLH